MGDMPQNRHGMIPMLVAIRMAAERKRRQAEAARTSETTGDSPDKPVKKKKRGWFG
jgi:hypothetical protein